MSDSTEQQDADANLIPPPSADLASAPAWRREPYRLFFPLGVFLSWAGIGPWLALAAFEVGTYSAAFHSIAQSQGFMMAFVTGFLFTAIPRRTKTAAPATWEMLIGLGAPIGTTAAAGLGAVPLAQLFWVISVLVLVVFVVRRFLSSSAGRRPPNSFVWLPMSFAIALGGVVVIGFQRPFGNRMWWLHDLGKDLVTQGMLLGLIVGVGGMVIPLITCGDAPPDGEPTPRDRKIKFAHLLAAAALVLTFLVELKVSERGGLALRAALVLALLLTVAKIWRRPRVPGWHRWLVWFSAWCLPLGYAFAALEPAWKHAGLHVVFIGGFGLMALAVGAHVSLAHGGREGAARANHWPVPFLGGLILLSLGARVLLTLDPARSRWHMGVAAAAFIVGTVFWLALVVPQSLAAKKEG